jgi:hypothetical protein
METAFWILAGAVVAYLAIDVPAGCQLTAPGFAAPPARALFRVQTDDRAPQPE